MSKSKYVSAFSYIFRFISPHKWWYITASIISLILVGTSILNARITQMLVDNSISGNIYTILVSVAAFLLIVIVNMTLNYISGIAMARLSANTSRDLKRHMASQLLNAKFGEINQLKSGDVLSTVNADTKVVCTFLSDDLTMLFSQLTMALGGLIYLLALNPMLALVTFSCTPIGVAVTMLCNTKMSKLHPKSADFRGIALSVVEQALSQIPVIKSFLMEKLIKRTIHKAYQNNFETEVEITLWNSILNCSSSFTFNVPHMLYLAFAGLMVIRGEFTIGAFIAVFDLLRMIIEPTSYFPFMIDDLNKSVASINRIKRLDDIPLEDKKISMNQQNATTEKSIVIDNITFSYHVSRPILQNFSMSHYGNGIIAICGASGTGKTTLLDIISGLYAPHSGTVAVQGDISIVSQDTYLFNDNVLENVRIARQSATDDDVMNAIRMAGAADFVASLPNGCLTMLGDGNTSLSGGQMQRISLSRTILQNNPIWLLDEPTSALDVQTEQAIIDVISDMKTSKLIIISAHRKSLISIAEYVIDLKGGLTNV